MNYLWDKSRTLLLVAALPLALTACANLTDRNADNQPVPHSAAESHHQHNPDMIPSYHGPKTLTTNEHGKTTSGMGTSVYSLIGSSSLHEGGISSHVQSRLAGQGIEGVKAFVLNDTVILAREKPMVTANHYDKLQQKVLSPMENLSGKGVLSGSGNNVNKNNNNADDESVNSGAESSDNMEQAKEEVGKMFGGNVHILTVTNSQAFELMDRIVSKLHSSPSDSSIANDIAKLLRMTAKTK